VNAVKRGAYRKRVGRQIVQMGIRRLFR